MEFITKVRPISEYDAPVKAQRLLWSNQRRGWVVGYCNEDYDFLEEGAYEADYVPEVTAFCELPPPLYPPVPDKILEGLAAFVAWEAGATDLEKDAARYHAEQLMKEQKEARERQTPRALFEKLRDTADANEADTRKKIDAAFQGMPPYTAEELRADPGKFAVNAGFRGDLEPVPSAVRRRRSKVEKPMLSHADVARMKEQTAPAHTCCGMCDEPLLPGQPAVPGKYGSILHLDCSAREQDGDDIDNEKGDS